MIDENPYQVTTELSDEPIRRYRAGFGYVIISAVCGAGLGFALATVLLAIYAQESPPYLYQFIPVARVAALASLGAIGGAIWEYYARD